MPLTPKTVAAAPTVADSAPMRKVEAFLLTRDTPTFSAYYNGKMSYALHGKDWDTYVSEAFPNLSGQNTSENVYKTVIDLYGDNLVPEPEQLRGFSNCVVPLLSRGECPVVVDSAGTPHFPEHFEMISDGKYTVVAVFTRDLEKMLDYVTFVYSNGEARVFAKDVPDDLTPASREGYRFLEASTNNTLFRFALDDKGFGASLAALQDRVNHSIIDQTIVAEMYARPFWYLLNVQMPPKNPFLPASSVPDSDAMTEHKPNGSSGRVFTTSSDGPFGQLTPPTIQDMIAYHDSVFDKVSTTSGIPQHYFKPGSGVPPTGVALKVLSKRFNNKVSRMREDIQPQLEELATLLGVPKEAVEKDADGNDVKEYQFWSNDDDLLQEAMDAHGIALSQMGYPLEYIAEVVTPGIDLDDYIDDSLGEPVGAAPGQPTDMTAPGQQGLVATPGQVQAYGANPGQKAKP
jgi:hypothetical protein